MGRKAALYPACTKDRGSDCVHQRSRVKRHTREKPPAAPQTLPFSSKSTPSPRHSPPHRVASEGPSPPAPDITSPDARSSAFSLSDRTLSNSSTRESRSPESDALDEFEPSIPQERAMSELNLCLSENLQNLVSPPRYPSSPSSHLSGFTPFLVRFAHRCPPWVRNTSRSPTQPLQH